jgi:SpoVK/Ycf46/Vps4 family AAA+-type ATPase
LKNSVILFEDICAQPDVFTKTELIPEGTVWNNENISKALNFIDGINTIDNTILIFTTNYPERINPVFLRKGRMDYTYTIDAIGYTELQELALNVFDKSMDCAELLDIKIIGCVALDIAKESKDCYEDFVTALINFKNEESQK